MTEEKPVRGKHFPIHVMHKFREKNQKAAFEAQVQKVVSDFNEALETYGELRNRRLVDCTNTLGEAVAAHFRKAGWTVSMVYSDSTCVFSIKTD